jgi:hypothetical protein
LEFWFKTNKIHLKWTIDYAFYYTGFPIIIEEFNNANWNFGSKQIKSICGYVFTLYGGIVCWKSVK